MIRLPRPRDLDPDLTYSILPFYLRRKWLWAGMGLAVFVQFLWALTARLNDPDYLRLNVRLIASVFVAASSLGYFCGRLGNRFIGVSWVKIYRGKERAFDTWLGRAAMGCSVGLVALPVVVNELVGADVLLPVPFYSGAAVGMGFSYLLWTMGLPNDSRMLR